MDDVYIKSALEIAREKVEKLGRLIGGLLKYLNGKK
jgi:hypothetical protein